MFFFSDGGILLSNSIIKKLKNNLDWCVKTTYSSSDDVNFGRCILHSSSISCSNIAQKKTFFSSKLNVTFDYDKDFEQVSNQDNFNKSITVYPVFDHLLIYKLNVYFAEVSLIFS